ncbi:protein farnesyltransferase/geranylgeranyltransferase type-1 subunit alpha [Diabrotica virgifera virgifera]|uniref:Protein farnesyltransferase/geranylgeranyltransferase type-1 subunit alpha n=1 Tax=Diabrotica virgifera virgifera TaxID=50390 RepID=A0A6P7G7G4_DIAVI|nr:protein farnesyltransferase/geranylgeranyltransferase type-1 subunit alpha [Diabrotica virgifera virgifera]
MSDLSSDENEPTHVLYRDRPEWKDVTPVKQDDADEPVVAIDYTEAFVDCYDYFRAIVQNKEISERALELTKTAASLNPANYTVWQYRRDILKGLNKDLHEELDYIEKVILRQSKNYQVWHHRKILVEWLQDPAKEKQFTEAVLVKDAKNYHAWQHRQWVIKTFKLFDGELNYVEDLINNDIRNNSAWNQRYFVINNTTGFTEEVLEREIQYTLHNIRLVTENESAWNYLRGLLLHDKAGLSNNKKVTEFCNSLYESGNRSPFLLAIIVDMCYEQITEGSGDSEYTLERAKQLCEDLINKYDKIRANYWQHMLDTLQSSSKSDVASGTTSS